MEEKKQYRLWITAPIYSVKWTSAVSQPTARRTIFNQIFLLLQQAVERTGKRRGLENNRNTAKKEYARRTQQGQRFPFFFYE